VEALAKGPDIPLTMSSLSGIDSERRDPMGIKNIYREPAAAATIENGELLSVSFGRAAESGEQRNDEAFGAPGDSHRFLFQQFLLAGVIGVPIEVPEFLAPQEIDASRSQMWINQSAGTGHCAVRAFS
jgi:hypothetical protein